ncbi:alpha/beta-hydrolase [Penicillium sp. IBT 18751x]|nr:alpha/beta-hydrolase [Penicillium sp. IBT 18751x]
MAWIHGGSLMFGSASYSIYDGVNLVSQSIAIGLPIVMVSFNYCLGLDGFLASSKIADELKQDGFAGNGNFGFTDQKVAMEWVQKYIAQFGGDPDNVTAVGQSAGGISIGHHMVANDPIKFHRAVCMSGLGSTLRPRTLQEHETLFNATCRHFSIDPRSSDALNQLRQVAQQVLADADNVIQNVNIGTGNPCDDGWFYARSPNDVSEAPTWLKSFLIGDVHDEGVVFIENLQKDTYDTVRSTMITHVLNETFVDTVRSTMITHVLNETFVDTVLKLYHIHAGVTGQDLINRVCNMGADAVFKIQNYQTALVNRRLQEEKTLVKYHVDQRSRLPNILLGKAYHGIDILYLFGNLKNNFNEDELAMALDFQSAWIQFINGQTPWQSDHTIWKIWGPNSLQRVETEREDEAIRRYSRFKCLLALGTADHLWDKYLEAMDFLLMKRDNAGTGGKRGINRAYGNDIIA